MLQDREVRRRFGASAVVSRAAGFVLVHLDNPPPEVIHARTARFDPEDYFDEDCPMCEIQRAQGLVIFDDYGDSNAEEIIVD